MSIQFAPGTINELKNDLKQTWSKLTDDDLNRLDAGPDQLIWKVQNAYGLTKETAIEEFNKFKALHSNYFRDDRDLTKNRERDMATASQLEYEANKIKRRTSHMIEDNIIEPSREYLEKARDLGVQVVDRSSRLVKENPGYAVLGAATVGFLAGAYFFRRRS